MSRYVDLDERVTAQFYDEECEEWTMQTCTIADVLDSVCDEYTVLPPAQPEIIRCKNCKHNPKDEWFGCPMSHLSESQRPETAWCWKGEMRTDESLHSK